MFGRKKKPEMLYLQDFLYGRNLRHLDGNYSFPAQWICKVCGKIIRDDDWIKPEHIYDPPLRSHCDCWPLENMRASDREARKAELLAGVEARY